MDAQAFINDEIRDLGGQEYLDHNDPETVIRTLMRLMLPQENSRFRVGMSEQLYLWASPLYGGYGPDTLQTIEKILNRGLIENAANPAVNAAENMSQNREPLPSGPTATTGVSRASTAVSSNSSVAPRKRRGHVKEHSYTEVESRIILQAHEELDLGTLPEWDTKGVLQQRLASFFTQENPASPVSANSVLGRYNRMTKLAGKEKKIQPPQKINGEWLGSADRAIYLRAIGRELQTNSASAQPSSG